MTSSYIFTRTLSKGTQALSRIRKHAARGHEHRAIGNLLDQIELDILECKRIQALPEELARVMLLNLGLTGDFDEEIEGDVAI